MIRLFLLLVRVLPPFYWTKIGFTREYLDEGRFSIGSFLPFCPPSCTPLFPRHRILLPPHQSFPTPPPLSVSSVYQNLQNHLVVSVLKCGQRKIRINPNEINKISLVNSRRNVARLHT